jgi:hypothetical protein
MTSDLFVFLRCQDLRRTPRCKVPVCAGADSRPGQANAHLASEPSTLRAFIGAILDEPILLLGLGPTIKLIFNKRTLHGRLKSERCSEMKDFSNASFPPETIGIMKNALDTAVASLPDPVSSAHVQSIAETILRTAKEGERNPATLQRIALMELQIASRHS